VDKFLEHPRLFIFCNDNDPKVYIGSADWMTRNIENRVEVTCPIYDEDIKQELIDTFEISWSDNTKARLLNPEEPNAYRRNGLKQIRSQFATYDYYLNKLDVAL
jgi:polyphosphate kinase